MDHLMTLMFGQDFFEYTVDEKKTLPDFIPGRTKYESGNYGISNY